MKGYIYILRNSKDQFYIGSTDNLNRRLHQHKLGHTQTTRNMKDFEVALVQEFDSLKLARDVERRIKNLKRKDYIEKMIQDGYIRMSINKLSSFNG